MVLLQSIPCVTKWPLFELGIAIVENILGFEERTHQKNFRFTALVAALVLMTVTDSSTAQVGWADQPLSHDNEKGHPNGQVLYFALLFHLSRVS